MGRSRGEAACFVAIRFSRQNPKLGSALSKQRPDSLHSRARAGLSFVFPLKKRSASPLLDSRFRTRSRRSVPTRDTVRSLATATWRPALRQAMPGTSASFRRTTAMSWAAVPRRVLEAVCSGLWRLKFGEPLASRARLASELVVHNKAGSHHL
jgi:hypothetical protein